MVEPEIPDRCINHSICAECEHGPDDRAAEAVVPVVELVDGEGAGDEGSGEDWGVDGDQLPHRGVVVSEDLELGIEVEVEEDEAREGGGGVARREGLEAVVDLVAVAGADGVRVHDLLVARAGVGAGGDLGLADSEEVRAKAPDQPLNEYLEDGGGDERVEEPDDGVVDVPEGADANLHTEDDEDWNQSCHQRGGVDGNDVLAEGVGEFGVDNLAVAEVDGEGSSRRWVRFVDLDGVSGCYGMDRELLTPRPMAPMITMVRMSSHVHLSHCPNVGLRE